MQRYKTAATPQYRGGIKAFICLCAAREGVVPALPRRLCGILESSGVPGTMLPAKNMCLAV